MAQIACPACKTAIKVADADMKPGFTCWCQECGQRIRLEQRAGLNPNEKLLFPTYASDETLLDMGDTSFWDKKPPR